MTGHARPTVIHTGNSGCPAGATTHVVTREHSTRTLPNLTAEIVPGAAHTLTNAFRRIERFLDSGVQAVAC
jgi:hypothetical protein